MTTVMTPAGVDGAFTIDDLDHFPSDGNRYELIEGSLHVTPAPVPIHQRVVFELAATLRDAAPPEFEVMLAPLDVQLGIDTMVQPDVLIRAAGPLPDKRLEGAPLLVVEILSPTTRLYDLGTKRMAYREAGVGAYWVVDPIVPSLTTWRWDGDEETEVVAAGDEPTTFAWPFAVTVTPARLLLAGG